MGKSRLAAFYPSELDAIVWRTFLSGAFTTLAICGAIVTLFMLIVCGSAAWGAVLVVGVVALCFGWLSLYSWSGARKARRQASEATSPC